MLDLLPDWLAANLKTSVATPVSIPNSFKLKPEAVVMDLAKAYHTWINECFPDAIHIADRFHVHGYVIESLQTVRKSIQHTLAPRGKAILKSHHRLLNSPVDCLPKKSKALVDILLGFSPLLRKVWEWKEAFSQWYDCSPNVFWDLPAG